MKLCPRPLSVSFLGCSSHSLRYLCTGVSGPSQGLPPFIAGGYVDHQPIVKYDSETEKSVPQVSWMLKAEKDNAQYWEKSTQEFLKLDMKFSQYLLDLQDQYNQSKGFHTLQLMYGCELSPDGRKEGYYRYGYDGRDFLSFEKETLTWTAADREAQVMKRKWEAELAKKQYRKAYLEEECIEWLQRYLDYGNETLLRTEAPVVKVTRKADYDGLETLVCQVHGFYPKEIEANWVKDGEVWQEGTLRGLVAPNSDGTYYLLLHVQINPEEREHFRCHVEHDSLEKPLDVAWEEEPGERQTDRQQGKGWALGGGFPPNSSLQQQHSLDGDPQLDPVCVSGDKHIIFIIPVKSYAYIITWLTTIGNK
uniref:Major histocompatibility complex class I-related gene protein-like n=1 Tax=Podarcis muralis TaxID=64176 RepID=A0A670HLW6_PODMU